MLISDTSTRSINALSVIVMMMPCGMRSMRMPGRGAEVFSS